MSFVEENDRIAEENEKSKAKSSAGKKSSATQRLNNHNKALLTTLISNLTAVSNKEEFLKLPDNTALCKIPESFSNIQKITEDMIMEANESTEQIKAIISNTEDPSIRADIVLNNKRRDFDQMQLELDQLQVDALILQSILKRRRLIESVKGAEIISKYIQKFIPKVAIDDYCNLDIEHVMYPPSANKSLKRSSSSKASSSSSYSGNKGVANTSDNKEDRDGDDDDENKEK